MIKIERIGGNSIATIIIFQNKKYRIMTSDIEKRNDGLYIPEYLICKENECD